MASSYSVVALKSALFPWAALALIVGTLLTLAPALNIGLWGAIAATVGSALLSIAGALVITEIILKPLYVRDILQVARLSAEVHESGLHSISRTSKLDWPEFLKGSGNIHLAAGSVNLLRSGPWQHVMRLSRKTKRDVSVYIPTSQSTSIANELSEQWKKNTCGAKGSTLKIVPEAHLTQGLVLANSPFVIASLAEDPQNDDPVVMVFTAGQGESVEDSLTRGINRLADSATPPLYEG